MILEGRVVFFFCLFVFYTNSWHCLLWSEFVVKLWARSNLARVGNLVWHTCDQISLRHQSAVTRPSEQPCWVMHGSSFSCRVLVALDSRVFVLPSDLPQLSAFCYWLCFNVGAQCAWLEIGRRGEWRAPLGPSHSRRHLTSCPNHRYPWLPQEALEPWSPQLLTLASCFNSVSHEL